MTRTELTGHSDDGGDVALAIWQMILVDPDGRLRRAELFDNEADALGRLRVVAAWCRGTAEAARLLSTRDWDAGRAGLLGRSMRFVDHRPGLRDATEAGVKAFWTALFEQTADLHVGIALLDARSDRLAGVRMHVTGTTVHGGRFEQVIDQIIAVDGAAVVNRVRDVRPGRPRARGSPGRARARGPDVRAPDAARWSSARAGSGAPARVVVLAELRQPASDARQVPVPAGRASSSSRAAAPRGRSSRR